MDEAKIRRRLELERDRLQAIRDDLRADPATGADGIGGAAAQELSTYDQHPGDLGSDVFEQEKNQAILEQVEAELTEAEAALRRLSAGRYGICQACGKPIQRARLEALPFARFCLEDQARAEREAGSSRPSSNG